MLRKIRAGHYWRQGGTGGAHAVGGKDSREKWLCISYTPDSVAAAEVDSVAAVAEVVAVAGEAIKPKPFLNKL
jgi:hypothetical protein